MSLKLLKMSADNMRCLYQWLLTGWNLMAITDISFVRITVFMMLAGAASVSSTVRLLSWLCWLLQTARLLTIIPHLPNSSSAFHLYICPPGSGNLICKKPNNGVENSTWSQCSILRRSEEDSAERRQNTTKEQQFPLAILLWRTDNPAICPQGWEKVDHFKTQQNTFTVPAWADVTVVDFKNKTVIPALWATLYAGN